MFLNLFKKKLNHHREEVQRPTDSEKIVAINQRLARLEGDLGKAVSGYRLLLVAQNPDILPELIAGNSIEELDHSLTIAKNLTARIKDNLEKQHQAEQIPSGAPVRTPPDLDSLSPSEKIRHGLSQK